MILAVVTSISPIRGQCLLNDPIPSPLAENDPSYAELCGLGWSGGHSVLPCPIVDPGPTVEAGMTTSHGATVNITTPSYSSRYAAVWWEVVDSGYTLTFRERTVQDKPPTGYPSATMVRYGVTALLPNSTYYVRSAVEVPSGKKSCWSAWATIQTTSVSASGPSLPSELYVKYEDDFKRPATDPQHAQTGNPVGNGIGPQNVYYTSDVTNAGQTLQIDSSGTQARAKPSSAFYFLPRWDEDDHSLTQIKVRVHMDAGGPGFAYNLQTQVRIGEPNPTTGVQQSYAIKLVKGARGCTNATLLLFRLPDEYVDAKCETIGGQEIIDPDIGGAFCTAAPPLDEGDSTRPGYSKPVWLRGEVYNDLYGIPVIRGQAYWYDSSGNLQSCTAIAPTRTDTGDPGNMADIHGRWGAGFHEKTYVIDEIIGADGLAP
ncbi:MAG: hypothetical protein MUF27_05585 [Acidobacteria bacterium]|jgi:hypothetical protein|nr:hypothetical protein [Acidobacteriota bacterium]